MTSRHVTAPAQARGGAHSPSRSFCGSQSMSFVLFPRFFGLGPENLKCAADNRSLKTHPLLLLKFLH